MQILVNSIANPIQIGIYENDILVKTISKDGKTSDILPEIFASLDLDNITSFIYVNSPGSYMAIKVAYIYLKTLSIAKNIKFFAIGGFELNQNSPIKALGKKYFFNINDTIVVDNLNNNTIQPFELPKNLHHLNITNDTLPKYFLPAC